MPKDKSLGKPTTRRYTVAENGQVVRLVRQATVEGREAGAITRVAQQLGFGVESVRSWVKDADRTDGLQAPTCSPSSSRKPRIVKWSASYVSCVAPTRF